MDEGERFRDRTQTVQFQPVRDGTSTRTVRKSFLTVIRGGAADLGRNLLVESAAVLGRDPECDLPLQDPGISWRHARVSSRGDEVYLLEDLGSTNGTRVDGGAVERPWVLRDGEKIFLGKTVVRFALADEMEIGFHREVAQLVSTDPLTGLESKRRFDDALDLAVESARASSQPLAVLMMDLDGIKAINDRLGHLFGAFCIQSAGRIIGRILTGLGHSCRFGGDEFTAFLPGQRGTGALRIAERIRLAIDEAGMERDGVALHPTISIGVAVFPEDADGVLELVAAADQALYRAKAKGKNQVSD